ncbi:hypothetical protein BN7_1186 [Wickerhamomyces ciferrii]|uniref:Signal recognition particle receptor subunit alpha homolog n=1 Tax=Wickerhamomyces ciferrii (strain ATCC 14091 / BCRC 22168 / CBS 111 / JCM 3599 / NBRC 0793 / NRRL Y-1031 F-60-10) TaxID=1206466 RepID=K0K9P8_WICCF|nr:uncharacterized protein BN7_1186 [Wickerhamomyces ciferrii]CCH41645.1 hypothetical protein BN7_1186 [Wickerhamomyces ciferrii]
MIDQFVIFTPSGLVLYRHAPRKIPDSVINSLISNVFISDNARSLDDDAQVDTYNTGNSTIKYKSVNNPNIVVATVYPSLTPLKYSEELVDVGVKLFVELLGDGIVENIGNQKHPLYQLEEERVKFDRYLKSKLSDFELQSQNSNAESSPSLGDKELDSGASTPNKKTNGGKSTSKNTKKFRKWGADGMVEEDSDFQLDFSSGDIQQNSNSAQTESSLASQIDTENYGNKDSKTGAFLVKDLNDEIEAILNSSKKKQQETKEPFGFLKKFTGGKTITSEDIKSTLSELQNHLIRKNVAPEVAQHLTHNVEKALVGSKTKNWTSIQQTAKEALANALTKILTPGTSVNLLQDIRANKKPYVISVVGVNGVGKSTNLSKLAFWLLQNDFKVLIVACDTFRSGAVEQLRVHVNNLKRSNEDQIELFEGGYGGSDLVAKIAKNAIEYAKKQEFDIILMDTAGRRHNDARLMAPLASFAKAANPNKIIMVGEALVGTDSVQQAKNFNNAFGAGRTLDFFIISKCDTVGDLIGTMVNMVYATNIPILFVGVGQTYTDLRTLSVEWAVNILMS